MYVWVSVHIRPATVWIRAIRTIHVDEQVAVSYGELAGVLIHMVHATTPPLLEV